MAYIFKGHINKIRKWLFIFENTIERNKIAIQGAPQMAVDKEARADQESTHIVITRRVPV